MVNKKKICGKTAIIMIIVVLIVGIFMGSQLFPKTNYVQMTTSGQTCPVCGLPSDYANLQTREQCYQNIAYWTNSDLNSIYGNYCYHVDTTLDVYCKNYIYKLKGKVSANLINCQNNIPANQLTFSVYP
jgi:hypothetical protein